MSLFLLVWKTIYQLRVHTILPFLFMPRWRSARFRGRIGGTTVSKLELEAFEVLAGVWTSHKDTGVCSLINSSIGEDSISCTSKKGDQSLLYFGTVTNSRDIVRPMSHHERLMKDSFIVHC